ncbi:hypothetical protein ACN28C_04625 [Plantactinospora sp. WMMC1484]|uniref:hypothetical protein n=1 Tax=Plantactinospora sp. WMMC1484 TaxID=3404122 RepID=UPI003BF52CAB
MSTRTAWTTMPAVAQAASNGDYGAGVARGRLSKRCWPPNATPRRRFASARGRNSSPPTYWPAATASRAYASSPAA